LSVTTTKGYICVAGVHGVQLSAFAKPVWIEDLWVFPKVMIVMNGIKVDGE
jgi:hypothetical protein